MIKTHYFSRYVGCSHIFCYHSNRRRENTLRVTLVVINQREISVKRLILTFFNTEIKIMSLSIRIKVQLDEANEKNSYKNSVPMIKFIYVIESPSQKTIDELLNLNTTKIYQSTISQ
jgi:hypothetical protein